MFSLPQGPKHSAQGDQEDQPQFTEGGPRARSQRGVGAQLGGLGEDEGPLGEGQGRASPAQSGSGRQRWGRPSWQVQSWQSALMRWPGRYRVPSSRQGHCRGHTHRPSLPSTWPAGHQQPRGGPG